MEILVNRSFMWLMLMNFFALLLSMSIPVEWSKTLSENIEVSIKTLQLDNNLQKNIKVTTKH